MDKGFDPAQASLLPYLDSIPQYAGRDNQKNGYVPCSIPKDKQGLALPQAPVCPSGLLLLWTRLLHLRLDILTLGGRHNNRDRCRTRRKRQVRLSRRTP